MSDLFVKICGITNTEDAQIAIDAGASAIGIVLSEATRQIEIAEAHKIRALVTEPVQLVGVFRNITDPRVVKNLASEIGLTTVQLHDTAPEVVEEIARTCDVLEAFAFNDLALSEASSAGVPFIVDSVDPGSGQLFNHENLKGLDGDFIVAGGLTPDNVSSVVAATQPYGVDVSSGVCGDDPRKKDPDKVASFIHSARNT